MRRGIFYPFLNLSFDIVSKVFQLVLITTRMISRFVECIGIQRRFTKHFPDVFMSGLLVSTKIIQFITVAGNGFPRVLV